VPWPPPAGAGCRCTRTDTRTPPAGVPGVPTQTVCDHIAACGPAGGFCTPGPHLPNPTTGDSPTPGACPPPTCKPQYFY
jgi:hypothetical protein